MPLPSELAPLFDEIIITRSNHPRSMEIPTLKEEFLKQGREVKTVDGVGKAIELARRQALYNSLICITGSLFVAGDALSYLNTA